MRSGSQPIVCGGFGSKDRSLYDALDVCHKLDLSTGQWRETKGRLPTPMDRPGHDYRPDTGLILAGGYSVYGRPTSVVVATRNGAEFSFKGL